MIEAMVSLRERRPGLPVALALVVGEEEEGDGAQTLCKEYHFPWAVIGEPTDLQPCLSNYGYLEMQVLTRGRRRHASLANDGRNPIQDMLNLLLRYSGYMASRPELVYNIRDLMSSPEGFVVPELCEAWIDLHLPPASPLGEIARELEEVAAQAGRDDPGLLAEARLAGIHAGYQLSDQEPMARALREIYAQEGRPFQPRPFRSHSDANLLWAAGIKPLILGPGRLEEAHAPEEWVDFGQVRQAAGLYFRLAEGLLS